MVKRPLQLATISVLVVFAPLQVRGEEEGLRLARPTHEFMQFTPTMSAGYSERWLQRFGNPSFCRMGLCHGTCADPARSALDESIVDTPSFYTNLEDVPSGITPCGLRTFDHLLGGNQGACCQPQAPTSLTEHLRH
jgi:hypothetical protein